MKKLSQYNLISTNKIWKYDVYLYLKYILFFVSTLNGLYMRIYKKESIDHWNSQIIHNPGIMIFLSALLSLLKKIADRSGFFDLEVF